MQKKTSPKFYGHGFDPLPPKRTMSITKQIFYVEVFPNHSEGRQIWVYIFFQHKCFFPTTLMQLRGLGQSELKPEGHLGPAGALLRIYIKLLCFVDNIFSKGSSILNLPRQLRSHDSGHPSHLLLLSGNISPTMITSVDSSCPVSLLFCCSHGHLPEVGVSAETTSTH